MANEGDKKETNESKIAEDVIETAIGSALTTDTTTAGTVGAAEPQSEHSVTQKSVEIEDKTTAVEATTVSGEKEATTTAATTTATVTVKVETTSTNDTNTPDDHMEVNDAYETLV